MAQQKSNAARIIDFLKNKGVSSIAVGGTDVIWIESIGMPKNALFSLEYKAASSGNVKLKIEFEQGNTLLTEAEEELTNADYVVPDDANEINDELEDALVHIKAVSPATTGFGRFKISGIAGNDASTVIDKLKLAYVLAI